MKKYIPAKRILIRSKGCKIKVEATPPEIPATRCSYFTWLRKLGKNLAFGGELDDLMLDIIYSSLSTFDEESEEEITC